MDQHQSKVMKAINQMQQKEKEIVDLQQLLERQHHEFVESSIGVDKRLAKQTKQTFEL